MKKFMKKLIPFLLVLVILASLVWYGFVYDRNYTRDILLGQARLFSTNGYPKVANFFYDTAYNFSDQDDGVAIELANQFKAVGNYTKAEYTLSHAIADGGTPDLYVALCKTYVEQDKLLDAVNMLDNIQDASIKRQLDFMRPKAPYSDPEPGFFNQYIDVSLKSPNGTIYYTTNGEYPSTDDIPYADPIKLPAGETSIYAVSVGEDGLVSPLSILSFTVGGVIEQVSFEDPAIEGSVRELLGVGPEDAIFTNQLWEIKSYTVPEDAQNFADLAKFSYLESLTVTDHRIESLSFLNSLTFLKELSLTDCKFSPNELSIIASLPALRSLTLEDCGLSTLAGLEAAQSLEVLNLAENTVQKLDPISGIFTLRSIDLRNNALTGLSALSGLVNLEKLNISYNSVSSIAPIATCVKLAWLDVSHNSLSNLSGIDNLPALTHLSANHNSLSDVSVLGNCTGLVELDLGNNTIQDVSALGKLEALELLDLPYNQIEKLPSWPDGSALRTINGNYNKIKSVSSLKNLMELTHIYMDYNEIKDIAPLANCYKLVMVNVYGNAITGEDKLLERDIIVNYNPAE